VTYEDRMKRLQTILALLDSGRQPLGEALELFREAVELASEALNQLRAMEQRAQELIATADGAFELIDIRKGA